MLYISELKLDKYLQNFHDIYFTGTGKAMCVF